jgi:hypothetical protein
MSAVQLQHIEACSISPFGSENKGAPDLGDL